MRGRQVFMNSLVRHGVRYMFGNPGTTESPILDALLDYPQVQYIVALHEGVALGAASYYAQTSGTTAVVNVHVAPGLGNALGMLYNALKARAPLVVTAGQQDTRLRLRGPVLGHDLVAMAAPLTKWSVQIERADEVAPIMHRALKIASDPPAGPVFVALPIDVMEQETDVEPFAPGTLYRAPAPEAAGIRAAASATPAGSGAGARCRRPGGSGPRSVSCSMTSIGRATNTGPAGGSVAILIARCMIRASSSARSTCTLHLVSGAAIATRS